MTRELADLIERHIASGPLAPWRAHEAPHLTQFGRTMAFMTQRGRPSDEVFCFNARDVAQLPAILALYKREKRSPTFYLSPMGFGDEVAAALTAAGFRQTGFKQAILYGLPTNLPPVLPAGMELGPVTAANLKNFVETKAEGFAWHPSWRAAAKEATLVSIDATGASNVVVRMDGQIAGVASMGVQNGIASLLDATVLPRWRGKGCHMALIQYRLQLASAQAAILAIAGADFGSPSFRNLLRAGFRQAYIESVWQRLP